METKWLFGLLLLTLTVTLSCAAPGPLRATPGDGPCHTLMTEAECIGYQLTLSTLPPGEARAQLIAEYRATVRERESACSCDRPDMDAVIYPQVAQIARVI